MTIPGVGDRPRKRRLDLPIGLQFSLSEGLTLMSFVAVGAAALTQGGLLAAVFVQLAWWTIFGIGLSALIVPGAWRRFAIGFVFGAMSYALPVLYQGEVELYPHAGRLPLTRALSSLWDVAHRTVYVDVEGNEFDESEVEAKEGTFLGMTAPSDFAVFEGPNGGDVKPEDRPLPKEFMIVAHALLCLAIGYGFGKLATMLYRSQVPPNASDSARP